MGGDSGSKSAGVVGLLTDAQGGSGRTLGKYDTVLWYVVEVWSCDCWTDSDPDPDPDPDFRASPSSDPLFVLDALVVLPKRFLLCHGWRNENVAPNERHCSGFDSGASIIASSDLEGVNAGGDICFGISKWNGFGTVLVQGWEAVELRLFDAPFLVSKVLYLRSHSCWYWGRRWALASMPLLTLPSGANWRCWVARSDTISECRTYNCQTRR